MSINFYSTDTDQGVLSIIRQSGSDYEVIKKIRVGNAPRGSVKFRKDGRGFVSNTSGNTISEIDALNHTEVTRITVGNGPRGIGIIPGDKYALVSNSGSDSISIVDLDLRKEIKQIPVGADPRHMAITEDGKSAYICIWGDGHIAKLDISSLVDGDIDNIHQTATIALGENSYPYSLTIDPSGKFIFVACNSTNHIPVLDVLSDKIHCRVPVECSDGACGARACAFSADGTTAFVTLERTSNIAAIDMNTMTILQYIPTGPGPRGIVQINNTLACATFARTIVSHFVHSMSHSITFIDLNGVDLKKPIPDNRYKQIKVGHGPCSIAVFDPKRVSSQVPTTTDKAAVA